MRRLRLGDLRKLLRDRCRGSVLPDDDAGREYLREFLLPISTGPPEAVKRATIEIWGPTDRMRREIELWAPWMSEDEARELRLDINAMPMWQRKPMARTLGERLQVTYAERARLGLRTIGPCDNDGGRNGTDPQAEEAATGQAATTITRSAVEGRIFGRS